MVWVGVGCTCVSMYGLGWCWLYMCEYVWFGLAVLTIFVLTVSHITSYTNYLIPTQYNLPLMLCELVAFRSDTFYVRFY